MTEVKEREQLKCQVSESEGGPICGANVHITGNEALCDRGHHWSVDQSNESARPLVQLESTGKCVVCGEAVVLERAAYLGHDNNFRPQEFSRPGDKVHCGDCARKIKDERPLRCPHCKGDSDPIEFRVDVRTGMGVFFHGAANCMKIISCQFVSVQRATQPSSIVVPGGRLGRPS